MIRPKGETKDLVGTRRGTLGLTLDSARSAPIGGWAGFGENNEGIWIGSWSSSASSTGSS